MDVGHLPMEGVVDYLGWPITSRSTSGGWTSALFIIGVEMAERFAYYGVSANLITYLTGHLGESTASAAANVNAWAGAAWMLPLLGGLLADYCLGRYRTIVFASVLYVLGLSMLTLSAAAPSLHSPGCSDITDPKACLPTPFQKAFFYISIYLVAIAVGGHKPCLQAFGADQFDEDDPEECKSKSSFFNWLVFGLSIGSGVTVLLVGYVQDSISWGIGFGLPCASMAIALAVFLMGTKTYRFHDLTSEGPRTKLSQVCVATLKSWRSFLFKCSADGHNGIEEAEAKETLLLGCTHQSTTLQSRRCSCQRQQETTERVEGMHGVLRLLPIWATCLIFGVFNAQSTTFFTKQGNTMDRRLSPSILVPPVALHAFVGASMLIFVAIYDRVTVPLLRMVTGIPSGITTLQRIGTGIFLSAVTMVIAATVEMTRLRTARESGLVGLPNAAVPMSLWWLVPQYVLVGISSVFTMAGLQEFFYDQVPDGLRSFGLALNYSIFGIGNIISSSIVSAIDELSRRSGESWFDDDLNRSHLDYFYWLLAGLSTVEMVLYLYAAHAFRYKKKGHAIA